MDTDIQPINTIVTASDTNYLWGVFLLIASMRKNGMNEPVIVLGEGYSEAQKQSLKQFNSVEVYDAGNYLRSMNCAKPAAMLLAKTEFASWIDCDGFFSGNCSDALLDFPPDRIHIRMRGEKETEFAFAREYAPGEPHNGIPRAILDIWKRDVEHHLAESRLRNSCGSGVFIIHRKHRAFLELFKDQIDRILPRIKSGVTDSGSFAYRYTDEAIMNSLLCFSPEAPLCAEYRMDRHIDRAYLHFSFHPKPWQGWTPETWKYYDAYLEVVDYCLKQGLQMPNPLPWTLQRRYRLLCHILCVPIREKARLQRLLKKIKQKFKK